MSNLSTIKTRIGKIADEENPTDLRKVAVLVYDLCTEIEKLQAENEILATQVRRLQSSQGLK